MKRREFITLLGGAAAAWPGPAWAPQDRRTRRIGILTTYAESHPVGQSNLAVFREMLQKLDGWKAEYSVDTRSVTGDAKSLKRSAEELVALRPDLILSNNTPTTSALLQHTRTIPLIFASVSDPVGSGFVASFARPGGNVTGFTNIEVSQAGKWLGLLKEVAPSVNQVAFIFNPQTASHAKYYLNSFKDAAALMNVEAIPTPVRDGSELEPVITTIGRKPNAGLVAMTDNFLNTHQVEIVSLASRHHLPAVYPYRHFAELGGLLSYGSDPLDNFARGDLRQPHPERRKASDLPVQAPTKFELVINLKTARALGLELPPTLLARADEVIE